MRRRFRPPRFGRLGTGSWIAIACLIALVTATACASSTTGQQTGTGSIKHVIVIMEENRSFDNYFGTFPGADGIPMQNGQPTVCVSDPLTGSCSKPFHDTRDATQYGGPHTARDAVVDMAGKWTGF